MSLPSNQQQPDIDSIDLPNDLSLCTDEQRHFIREVLCPVEVQREFWRTVHDLCAQQRQKERLPTE